MQQQKCARALDNSWNADFDAYKRTDLEEIVWSIMFLHYLKM